MKERPVNSRRNFLFAATAAGISAFLEGCRSGSVANRIMNAGVPDSLGVGRDVRSWARYPGKTDLIMLADRPPLLETPVHYFRQDLTPNEAYFVRWHYAGIPTRVDLRTFRLNVTGAVKNPLALSFDDLRTKFEPVTMTAFSQCAGNSRGLFRPQVPGAEWGNGAMGNARYVGARLSDVMNAAGVKTGVIEASFRGLDVPPLESSPPFEKALPIEKALYGDCLVAYEMNDEPLPMLNGFPVRLVVSGWYATYSVKALTLITLRTEPLHCFWTDTAYRLPATPDHGETPDHLSTATVPISNFSTRSIFVVPEAGARFGKDAPVHLEGVAMDDGTGIRRVEVSTDGGRSWSDAALDPVIDKYSWRRWRMEWRPSTPGRYTLQCRATNAAGDTQVTYEWNHSGYRRHTIQSVEIEVTA
jgi:sulfite dehydrogenase (cytochrome) subunit A